MILAHKPSHHGWFFFILGSELRKSAGRHWEARAGSLANQINGMTIGDRSKACLVFPEIDLIAQFRYPEPCPSKGDGAPIAQKLEPALSDARSLKVADRLDSVHGQP